MKTFFLTLMTIVLLTACGLAATSQGNPLDGTTWKLRTIQRTRVIDGIKISAAFKDGQITGRAGCNSYFGAYKVKADAVTITGPIGSTAMACLREDVMEQEQNFLKIIQNVEHYELKGGQLVLFTADGEALGFVPQ